MLQQVLKNLNINSLNKMQLAAIEAAKQKNDLILLSPTGSGKTLGFLLPLLNLLNAEKKGVQALILAPSRELALQIEQVFRSMGTGFKVNCCYGGRSTKVEKNNLEHPPTLLIGTPGRIAFHIRNDSFDVNTITTLVLDEFDKALEFGFQNDMSFIIYQLKKINRRILTSATQMHEVPSFVGVVNATELNYLTNTPIQAKGLTLKTVQSESKDKLDILIGLICKIGNNSSLIFCNHRDAVERISALLNDKGIAHGTFHGGMEQADRERALIKFRNGSYKLLVTTDLASRGLDIPEIENVIHYQLPHTEEVMIHRNGRTARMNANGKAYFLLGLGEYVPTFVKEKISAETLLPKNTLPPNSEWVTLYIASGKKDKINKIDIVGLLLQKGNLKKEELGLIEVLDYSSYVAVSRAKAEKIIALVKNEKIKNKKVKIEISQ